MVTPVRPVGKLLTLAVSENLFEAVSVVDFQVDLWTSKLTGHIAVQDLVVADPLCGAFDF